MQVKRVHTFCWRSRYIYLLENRTESAQFERILKRYLCRNTLFLWCTLDNANASTEEPIEVFVYARIIRKKCSEAVVKYRTGNDSSSGLMG